MAQVGEAGLDSTKFLSQYIMHVCAAVGVKAQFLNGIMRDGLPPPLASGRGRVQKKLMSLLLDPSKPQWQRQPQPS